MPETYLHKKLAEWWVGGPLATLNVFDVEQGRILEEEAIPWYELEYSSTVNRVGLITTDDGKVGCSPDGLLGSDTGIEIKCPAIHTHIGYLLKGEIPKEYVHQVQGSLYVTQRPFWRFVSYRRKLPALVLTVIPDEDYQMALEEALELFLVKFEHGKERLIGLNGGPPKRRLPDLPPEPKYESEIPS
jgi:hypothetical protein